jgi:hypothetical protein
VRAILRDRCQIKVVPVQASAAADQVSHDAIPEYGERERARERVGRRQAGSRAASHVQHAPQPSGRGGGLRGGATRWQGCPVCRWQGCPVSLTHCIQPHASCTLGVPASPCCLPPCMHAGRKKEYGRAPSRWQVSISTADASHGDVCEEYVRVCI